MKSVVKRAKNILISPKAEWLVIKDEPDSAGGIIYRYVMFLAMLPPLAVLVKSILSTNAAAARSPMSYLVATNALWYLMNIVNVLIAGAVTTAFVFNALSRGDAVRGFKLAAYSFTPLFIAGIVIVAPGMGWFIYVAILYSVYLLYLGTCTVVELPKGSALWYATAMFTASGIIIAVLNLLEYFLESFVADKVFFTV